MRCELYESSKHQEQLTRWYKQWSQEANLDLLPPTGLIIPEVAAIFMYYTDSKVCFVDGFICNPWAKLTDRNEALDILGKMSSQLADQEGYRYVVAFTKEKSVSKRAIKHNYTLLPDAYSCLVQDLNGAK